MVTDGGPPRCPGCHQPLEFGSDRDGWTTEYCACGYRGYVTQRCGDRTALSATLPMPRGAPGLA